MKPLAAFLLLTTIILVLLASTGSSAGNRETCEGYPEPRIFLENQSWWEPQPGPANHPGTGKQGHIHVGMCFPLYQTLSGSQLRLDVNIKLHNMPGRPNLLRAQSYDDGVQWELRPPAELWWVNPCGSADCEVWRTFVLDLTRIKNNGWHELAVFLNVDQTNGNVQRNWPGWYVNFQLPGKPQGVYTVDGQIGTGGALYSRWAGGDTWYSGVAAKYARASILRQDIPWDEATGALRVVSGVWSPRVRFEKRRKFAYVDPVLHAPGGPDFGTVVFDRVDQTGSDETLSVNTTLLTNGLHRLLVGTGNPAAQGTHSGVLVIPFVVQN